MPQNRFYVDTPLLVDSEVTLDEKEQRHLRVMRNPEIVELINGKGQLATAKVLTHGLKILKVVEEKAPPTVTLAQALPRMNRLDTIVEKCTEIGMAELWLFPGDLSEKKSLSKNQQERVTHLLIAALKQSGRLHLPKVRFMPPLLQWKQVEGQLLYGALRGGKRMEKLKAPLCFVIGPEAGFSENEERWLEQHGEGIILSDAILRTDTAPLVALALIHHFLI
ncbi:MAG: Ribosomal RNA small subunit methyltransferase E [Chlamydiales bacterium]|nr:Ribosomal RNA small subunit methyltransferase E [Chlamydiales bacterium]MCH9635759.1 Ribosomal RNA small subunit methyltransferase E [Chlamydiales bacterium]